MSLQGELGKAQEDIKALHSEQDRINKTITKTNEDMKELQKKFSDVTQQLDTLQKGHEELND